jgi:hypothetical protein
MPVHPHLFGVGLLISVLGVLDTIFIKFELEVRRESASDQADGLLLKSFESSNISSLSSDSRFVESSNCLPDICEMCCGFDFD